MFFRKPPFQGKPSRGRARRGFALIITLTLMILLSVLVVGLLGLSSVSLRSSSHHNAEATARANARMALLLAIGELQKATGPDQRITMTSGLRTGSEAPNPNWTGAVDVSSAALTPDPKSAPVRWLVSGDQADPATPSTPSARLNQGDALKLGTFNSISGTTADLLAPVVNTDQGKIKGRYAWWIGDEGTKARVDLAKPENPTTTDRERLALSQTPLEAGLASAAAPWAGFAPLPVGTIEKTTLVSMQTASLAAQNPALGTKYFNDVTTGGHGLPVNVAAGGMKADLSLIFDKSQITKKFGELYCGATPSSLPWNGAPILNFSVKNPSRFYLSDAISKNGSAPIGPNWGNLWNYATLWQQVDSHQMPVIGAYPMLESDLRFKNWLPYANHNLGEWRRDIQQVNSPVAPVLSHFQISFRLNSELAQAATPSTAATYRAQIGIQPVMGIWNPYNVAIRTAPYRLDWALYPYLRFNYGKPNGSGGFTDRRLTRLWLREEWTAGNGVIPTPNHAAGGKWLQLETPSIDLQPGEFRLFSVLDRIKISSGQTYALKPGWSERGAFIVDLRDDAGNARLVPAGYRAWFGDIVLQDTQSNEVKTKFPAINLSTMASTWFTLKSGNNILLRSTEIWNGGNDPSVSGSFKVPEPVTSGAVGTGTTKPTYLIEDLADEQTAAHIATWSFFMRTTNQVEEESQRLRGWIDSNPRALVTNLLWDGSKVNSTGERSGWHTTSHWVGNYNPPGKPRVVGDGHGGNRGMLAEGGSAIPEPEVMSAGGRYQGFGGAANTLAGGRTHSTVYDVPRSPLVSLGQFQHAQLSRYNFDPGFVVGNSYANPRIPLYETINPNFNGIAGLNITDVSHDVNRKLWDGYFFSTLGLDYLGATGSFDNAFDFRKLASGASTLPNPRMVFAPLPGDTTIDAILADNGDRAPEAIAARIMVKGAFNVNSTSRTAWKAVLASMGASELPVLNPQTRAVSWEKPGGTRFNRFGHVTSNQAYEKGGAGDDDPFWQGWRKLSDYELDELAGEIVREVKERGPFRSMAEFVNRNPAAGDTRHQLKGTLQAALDATVNKDMPESVGKAAANPDGAQFSEAVTDENVAVGGAAYVMQGDVLQSLAPILQVRSDYFKIRTCGEALDADGKVMARAWCEAHVQRTNAYVDPQDPAHTLPASLTSGANKTFGRRYEIVSFRWLSASEI